jgi:hypothetical protein
MSAGALSIEITMILPMLIQWGYDPHINFMSTGAWSIEIDHDPSPMLIQWGYDPSNPSSISCQLVLGPLKLTMTFAHVLIQ